MSRRSCGPPWSATSWPSTTSRFSTSGPRGSSVRGAGALAASIARPRAAGRLHRACRGIRAHRRDRPRDPREGLPAGARGGRLAGRAPGHEREPLAAAVPRPRPCQRDRSVLRRPASTLGPGARDHREQRHGPLARPSRWRSAVCGPSGSAWSSTTSGPATPPSPTFATCRSTRSRSTALRHRLDEKDPNVAIVQAVLSLAHGLGITSWPRASRPRARWGGCASSAVIWPGLPVGQPLPALDAAALLTGGKAQRRLPVSRSRNKNRLMKSR